VLYKSRCTFCKTSGYYSSVHIEFSRRSAVFHPSKRSFIPSAQPSPPLLLSFSISRDFYERQNQPSRPERPISKITHSSLGGCGMKLTPTPCRPFHVVAELPTLRPVSDVITLHLVHLMHPVAELRGCLAETAESVHSIFHIALLLTNRYAPLTRHSYSSPGREERYRTIDKSRKILLHL